jgi:hypothetical protein
VQLEDHTSFIPELHAPDATTNRATDTYRTVTAGNIARVSEIHRLSNQLVVRSSHRKSHTQT